MKNEARTAEVFRDSLLAGKVAVVTGGSSGINLGIARRLVEQGARVAVLARNPEKLAAAVAELNEVGRGTAASGSTDCAMGLPADVRDYAAVEAVMRKVKDAWGGIDILVCGAAGNFPAAALDMSANGFKAVVDIDVLGTFNTCRAAFEHFRRPGAAIINISAPQAFQPTALQAHVCAAKAGVDMLTKTLAVEWGPLGVRVNAVTPGPIAGTEGMQRLAPEESIREEMKNHLPLQRFGTPRDIAELVLFLCTPAASFITGAVMMCDGGIALTGFGRKVGG